VNPGITSLSVTGFGASGPLKNEPGFDPVLGAMSGMMFAQGGDAEPVMITMAINDVTAAVMVTLGAVLSVYATRAHGEPGQSGATSLAATSALAQVAELTRWPGREAPRVGGDDHLGEGPLTRSYRVADGWVRVHGVDGDERRLAGVGLLASDGSGAASGELELALIGRTRAEVLELFARAGVAAMPARTMAEAAEDEAVAAEQLVHDVPKSSGGIFVLPGRLARFSRTERGEVLAPPGLGEHTREVLLEAGLDESEVAELLAEGVLVEGGAMRLSVMPGYR
jgi:crotonobetainyl-CoA:carnitine CoA-transferase CaiB-like acyl-CoA transferase